MNRLNSYVLSSGMSFSIPDEPLYPKSTSYKTSSPFENGYASPPLVPPSKNPTTGGVTNDSNDSPAVTFTADGDVRNLPPSMIGDQFGIAGLMVAHKVAQERTVPLVFGEDIYKDVDLVVGNSLNEPLFYNYGGPFLQHSESACLSENAPGLNAYPTEYLVTARMFAENRFDIEQLRKILALRVNQFNDDLLFYIFYAFPRDILQLVAAAHLYAKGWRFHMEFRVWLRSVNENLVFGVLNSTCERGLFNCFDNFNWKIIQREMLVEANKLEGPPNLPQEVIQCHFLSTENA